MNFCCFCHYVRLVFFKSFYGIPKFKKGCDEENLSKIWSRPPSKQLIELLIQRKTSRFGWTLFIPILFWVIEGFVGKKGNTKGIEKQNLKFVENI